MMEDRTDRRVERTRRALHEALTELILEKRYDKITVQNIIDRANVGRSTFYDHFLDKEDLLLKGFTMFGDDLLAHLENEDHAVEVEGHILHSLIFFHHASENHELYRAMLEGGGADVLLEAGRQHLTEGIQTHFQEMEAEGLSLPLPLPVVTNYLAGAMLSVLMWWLKMERPYPPEEINAMFHQLAMDGLGKLLQTA